MMALMTPEERVKALEDLEERQLRRQTRVVRSAWTSVVVAAVALTGVILLGYWQLGSLSRDVQDLTRTKSQLLNDIRDVNRARAQAEKDQKETETIARATASEYNLPDRRDAETRLATMMPAVQCRNVTVSYYTPSAPRDYITQLTDTWTGLGFDVRPITFGIPRQMNAIWRGESVDPECLHAVALTLIRAGIPVREVGHPSKDVKQKARTIEIGYSGSARNKSPLTIEQLSKIY